MSATANEPKITTIQVLNNEVPFSLLERAGRNGGESTFSLRPRIEATLTTVIAYLKDVFAAAAPDMPAEQVEQQLGQAIYQEIIGGWAGEAMTDVLSATGDPENPIAIDGGKFLANFVSLFSPRARKASGGSLNDLRARAAALAVEMQSFMTPDGQGGIQFPVPGTPEFVRFSNLMVALTDVNAKIGIKEGAKAARASKPKKPKAAAAAPATA